MKDYAGMAAALYDGGWRSDDLYEIQREYNLDDIDRDEIVSWERIAPVIPNSYGNGVASKSTTTGR